MTGGPSQTGGQDLENIFRQVNQIDRTGGAGSVDQTGTPHGDLTFSSSTEVITSC